MNIIARLEFELDYFKAAVPHFNHCATGHPQLSGYLSFPTLAVSEKGDHSTVNQYVKVSLPNKIANIFWVGGELWHINPYRLFSAKPYLTLNALYGPVFNK